VSAKIISSHILIESGVQETDQQFSDALNRVVIDVYGHRPDWLSFSPGRRFVRGDAYFREFVCIAGSVALRVMQRARREDGLSRAIVYRADVDGIERTYEIRAGQETEFLPDELRPLSTTSSASKLLWWIIPGALAGMPMPFVHPERRLNSGGPLDSYEDELPALYAAGVRAVVSLLNIPSDAAVYQTAGFAFKCLPVADGVAPTMEQAQDFIGFVDRQLADNHPVAVHCEAGLGRTGTMLAVYLVSQGQTAESAIRRVRVAEGSAVETKSQIDFLERFAAARRAQVGGSAST